MTDPIRVLAVGADSVVEAAAEAVKTESIRIERVEETAAKPDVSPDCLLISQPSLQNGSPPVFEQIETEQLPVLVLLTESVPAGATSLEKGDSSLFEETGLSAGTVEYVLWDEHPAQGTLLEARLSTLSEQSPADEEGRPEKTVLEALHDVATTMQNESTIEDVCERIVAAATDVLDFDTCSVTIREGEWLVPYAVSAGAPEGGTKRMRIDQGLSGKTHRTQESYLIEDVTASDATDPADERYRSGISVPVGEHGVFQAVNTEKNGFDEKDIERAELLVSHAENAINRIEREEELTERNDRLSEFASIISHDLRNPLNVASLRVNLAQQEHNSEHLTDAQHSLKRMEALIDDLLTMSRAGKEIDEVEPLHLSALVKSCWQTVETGDTTLTVNINNPILADESRLKQLLENLIRNAIEHAPPEENADETLEITIGETDRGFYVADTGQGIPEDERDDIFDSGYSGTDAGTGFGLSIVEKIVDAHGWEISVGESESGGARFDITGVERSKE